MLYTISKWFALAGLTGIGFTQPAVAGACPPLLQHEFVNLQSGEPLPLCQYAGKVLLVVNTASKCAFTGQYEGLEALYKEHGERGLVVLGFPSNDFGGQEPGDNRQIADFCRLTYGVRFPMAERTRLKGAQANPFFTQLAAITDSKPRWNFHKYLISRDGGEVVAFGSFTSPDDDDLLAKLDTFLQQPAPAREAP